MKLLIVNRFFSFFCDNCKYLFLEILDNYPSLEVYFAIMDNFYENDLKELPVFPISKIPDINFDVCFIDNWLPEHAKVSFLQKKKFLFQLWHGVGLKNLKLVKRDYIFPDYSDYLLIPSPAVEDFFEGVFKYRTPVYAGYPRNIPFITNESSKMLSFLIGTDRDVIHKLLSFKEEGFKIVVFAPTFRRFSSNWPAYLSINFFEKANRIAEKFGFKMVFKLHPIISFLEKHLKEYFTKNSFKNLYVYTSTRDIYPLLKYTDLLISDYSSIIFDFLLTGRPFLFFIPDFNIVQKELINHRELSRIWNVSPLATDVGELIYYLKLWSRDKLKFDYGLASSIAERIFTKQDSCVEEIIKAIS